MATKVDGALQSDVKIMTVSARIPGILDEYNFTHERRGLCLIINNHHFNKQLTNQNDRDGTEVDAANCESTFMRLGFDVTRRDDLTVTEMSIVVREGVGTTGKKYVINFPEGTEYTAEENHKDADCFACVILSHGDENVIYGTNGTMRIDRLTANFKGDICEDLRGKPKLFFIQACRGRRYDFGTELDEDTTDSKDSVDSVIQRIPVEADFLMAYSVVPGHFSWRNNVDGSWFIQALCRVLQEHHDSLELMHLMTLVNKLVAYEFQSNTDSEFTSNMKQMPSMVSTLTKLAYLKSKY